MVRMFSKHYETRVWRLGKKTGLRFLGGKEEEVEEVSEDFINECDLAVICAPTPMGDEYVEIDGCRFYRCDTSKVEEHVAWLETPVILIKSTIEVGTTDRLKEKYGKRIVFSPEFVGESKYHVTPRMDFHRNAEATPMFIVGGDEQDCSYVIELTVPIMGPEAHYVILTAREAEFCKYVENDYFAHKVIWANEKKKQAEALGVNWWKVWEAWALDPRVDKMHTAVFKNKEGWSGKCLPKDMNALTYSSVKAGYEPIMEIGMLKSNLIFKKQKDYKEFEDQIKKGNY